MPVAEPNPRTLQEVSSAVYPKLERVPGKQNWVDKAGGLPSYIERIAKHLHYEQGKSISTAIAMAVNTVKRWATGTNHDGSKLKPATVAKAQKAVAEWEAKKGKSKLSEALAAGLAEGIELTTLERAKLVGALSNELRIAEGIRTGLKGKGTRKRAGRVAAGLALIEGREQKLNINGNADPRELARAQSMLGEYVASTTTILEALAPAFPRQQVAGPPSPRQQQRAKAKGRGGSALPFDESKHPRAAKGRTTGGQFIKSGSSGAEVKGVQRAVGAKPDGRFGPETKRKVEAFQKQQGLTVDGVVGSQTAAAISGNEAVGGPLLAHHNSRLRNAQRFTPKALAAADAKEKRQNKARKARKEAKKEAESKSSSSSSSSSGSSTTGSAQGGAGSVFGEGSSLPKDVADLIQRRLGIQTTGEYDAKTKARVEEFQRNHGLQVDGIVGTQTLAAMRGDETPPEPGGFTQSDWEWLTQHQAGGGEAKKKERGEQKQRQQKPIASPAEDSLSPERSDKLAKEGWDYHDGFWWPPNHPKNEKTTAVAEAAIAQDDFHRKYGAGMTEPDEATAHLQGRLTELGYDAGASDGRYGDKTKAAVEDFQGDHGLKVDGEVGHHTKVALRGTDPEEVAKSREKNGPVEDDDSEDKEAEAPKAEVEGDGGGEEPPKKAPADTEDGEPDDDAEPAGAAPGSDEDAEAEDGAEEDEAPSLAGAVLTKGAGVAEEEPDASVAHLQKTIGVEADGRFGPETERKVKSVQRRYGLKADGVVGPKTGRLLDRMAQKAKPKKDSSKEERDLNEAVLERMEASVEGGAAFVRARARETHARALLEASVRGIAKDAIRDFYRLDDGTFAPKGRGKILRPGEEIRLPNRSTGGAGYGHVRAKVIHHSGGRGLARIQDGPDAGQLAAVRTAAPQGSKAHYAPRPPKHRRDLPPGNPAKPSQVAEVVSQNALDHINDAINAGNDHDVQDHLDDMRRDHAHAEKQGYGAAVRNYDLAKERGEAFLASGGGQPTVNKLVDRIDNMEGGGHEELPDGTELSMDAMGHTVTRPDGTETRHADAHDAASAALGLPPQTPAQKRGQRAPTEEEANRPAYELRLETEAQRQRREHRKDVEIGVEELGAKLGIGQPKEPRPVDLDAAHDAIDKMRQEHPEWFKDGQRAPIDFHSASDDELDDLISGSVNEDGVPKSGRDRSIFLTALDEKKRRAKRAYENARSDAAKSDAASLMERWFGKRPAGAPPAPQYAPPEGYSPNESDKQLMDFEPGDTFYWKGSTWKFHKPLQDPWVQAKPMDENGNVGKVKTFNKHQAPPFVGPHDPNGSPSASATAAAPPATNEDDLYDALKGSLEQTGASTPKPSTPDPAKSPARGPTGKLRNFKAMGDVKLMNLAEEMKQHPHDVEAVKAITAELKNRSGKVHISAAGDEPKPKVKAPEKPSVAKTEAPAKASLPKTHEPAKVKKAEEKIASAWQAYHKKKSEFDALPSDTDKKTKAKAAAQVRAAKFRIKRVGGDFENPPDDLGPVTVSAPPKAAQPKGEPIPEPHIEGNPSATQILKTLVSLDGPSNSTDLPADDGTWSGVTIHKEPEGYYVYDQKDALAAPGPQTAEEAAKTGAEAVAKADAKAAGSKLPPGADSIDNVAVGDWFISGPNDDLYQVVGHDGGETQAVNPMEPKVVHNFLAHLPVGMPTEDEVAHGQALMEEIDNEPGVEPPSLMQDDPEYDNLIDASAELGEDWDGPKVEAALDKLETQGIVFDRANENPSVLAAVIKAANLNPADLG